MVLQVVEVRRIEKTVGLRSVEGEVVAEAGRAAAGRGARVVGLEPRGAGVDVSFDGALPQTRLRRQVDDGGGLLAVLRRHVAVDHFRRLEDPGVDRVGKGDSDLIRDRLPVHDVALLAVSALKVVTAVLVLREPGCLDDQGFHASRWIRRRGMRDEGLVDVHVG